MQEEIDPFKEEDPFEEKDAKPSKPRKPDPLSDLRQAEADLVGKFFYGGDTEEAAKKVEEATAKLNARDKKRKEKQDEKWDREYERAKRLENRANKKTKANHNKRTKDRYERLGFIYAKADHYSVQAERSFDLFGMFDAVAVHPELGVVFIQLTSKHNISARVRKIRDWKHFRKFLKSGAIIEVIGWEKNKSNRYEPTIKRFKWESK